MKFEDSLFHLDTSIHLLRNTMIEQVMLFQSEIRQGANLQIKVDVDSADLMRELLTDSQFSPTNI
jgi:hypothetical protein